MNEITMYIGKNQTIKMDLDNLPASVTVIKSLSYDIAKKYRDFISALEVCIEAYGYNVDIIDKSSYVMAVSNLENIVARINNNIAKIAIEINKKEDEVMDGSNVTDVTETVNEEEMVSMMEDVAKEMNGEAKGFSKVKEAVNRFKTAGRNTRKTVLHEAGVEKDVYINNVDESFNTLKDSFMGVITAIGNITGLTYLKEDLIAIIEAGADGQNSAKGFFRMARKFRELIDKEEKDILRYGSEKDIKRVLTLKSLTENERGKSVFEAFASLCIWLGNKLIEKFTSWGAKHQERKVFSAICNSIATVVNLIRKGIKLVWETAKFIASYAIAGVIKLGDIVFRAIRTLYKSVKCFIVDKITPDYVEDDIEDDEDDFFDNDEEYEE